MATNNPYDVSVFNEQRPLYVGPPVEDIAAARQTLTKAAEQNETERNVFDNLLSESMNNLNQDPDGINMVKEHVNNFKSVVDNIIAKRGLAYAGNDIRSAVNNFTKDYRIKNRIASLADWKGQKEAVLKNDKIDYATRKAFDEAQQYQFKGDDNSGIWDKPKYYIPVEDQDVNAELLSLLKSKVGNMDANSGITFLDANSNPTKYPDLNSLRVAIVRNGKTEHVDVGNLNELFKAGLRNNPKLMDYLMQQTAVNRYYKKGENPVAIMEQAKANPDQYEQILDNASRKLAENFAYKRTESDVKLQNFDLLESTGRTGSGGEPTVPEEIRVAGPGTNVPTYNTTEEQITDAKRTFEATKANTLGAYAQNIPQQDQDAVAASLATGNYDMVRNIAAKYKLDENLVSSWVPMFRDAAAKTALADAKSNAVDKSINKTGKYDSLFTEPDNKDIEYIASKGFDWRKEPGRNNYEKISNAISKFHSSITRKEPVTSPFSTGIIMGEQFIEPNGNDQKVYQRVLDNYLSKNRGKYNDYMKDREVKLREVNKAESTTISSQIPLYQYKSNKVSDSGSIAMQNLLTVPESIRGIAMYDVDGKMIKDKGTDATKQTTSGSAAYKNIQSILGNLDDVIVTSSNKSLPGSPRSFMITYKSKATTDNPAKTQTIYVPMGAENGGISTEVYNNIIANNPKYVAEDRMNEVKRNRINGQFTYPDIPNVRFNRNTDTENMTYDILDDNGNVIQTTNEAGARDAMANVIDKSNRRFVHKKMANELSKVIGDSAMQELTSKPSPNAADVISVLKRYHPKYTQDDVNVILTFLKNNVEYGN